MREKSERRKREDEGIGRLTPEMVVSWQLYSNSVKLLPALLFRSFYKNP